MSEWIAPSEVEPKLAFQAEGPRDDILLTCNILNLENLL